MVPLPSMFWGIKVNFWTELFLSISIDIDSSDELWILLTRDDTAWSPTPKTLSSIFNILSPASRPALKAAFSGWVAKTKIPGSGS